MKIANSELLKQIRELPHKPGIYIYRDQLHRVIYVGKARDLRKRVGQYFHPGRGNQADAKTRALLEHIYSVETHVVRSEPEAILLEGKLIKEYRPRYNISFKDDKHFLMVKVNLNEPFPRFISTRLKKEDNCRYIGPFLDSVALRKTLEVMRKLFHLRVCEPLEPKETDYKHCLYHIIQQCSAPCIGKISREDYKKNVEAACQFLEGESGKQLEKLEKQMQEAAHRMDFEKAARLRNMMEQIRRTTMQPRRDWRTLPTTILPEKDIEELQHALELTHLPEIIECFDISNISTTHIVASMVCFRRGRPDKSSYRRYRIRSVEGQDDFASMAEVIRRRYRRLQHERAHLPSLVVVDGGKGQLSAALAELKALGLEHIPLIGLAKQFEEIYAPTKSAPLRLSAQSGALKLLQRVRDEAHRFANAYHRLLMKQRMSESILDECPGISQMRKMALLQHFGSIEKIKRAPAEDLTQVKGISQNLAETIRCFFNYSQRQGNLHLDKWRQHQKNP